MYMMTPSDQISHDLSYFSGPNTSGAVKNKLGLNLFAIKFTYRISLNNVRGH